MSLLRIPILTAQKTALHWLVHSLHDDGTTHNIAQLEVPKVNIIQSMLSSDVLGKLRNSVPLTFQIATLYENLFKFTREACLKLQP